MHRRRFLRRAVTGTSTAALGLLSLDASGLPTWAAWAADLPSDVRVTRVVAFELPTKRSKVAGRNARLDVHGDRAADRMVRLYTNRGIEGLGACAASEQALRTLLGADPLKWVNLSARRAAGPLGTGTMPLWDLAGKVLTQPVYKLLGGAGPERVPVYDGSIYFADLLPQYAARWQDRFRQEIDMGRRLGHVAFKLKIGRGSRWMQRDQGDDRDVDVIHLVRRHGGKDLLIAVDANNGYDLAGAKRLIDRAGDADLAFVEELFPEKIDHCLELKRYMAGRGHKTLLADGETQSSPEVFRPFVAAGAIDVLQGDMKRFGFEGVLDEADLGAAKGVLVAPHNWGSLIGYTMQLHVGRAIKNFYRAEHDPLSSDVLLAEGYSIKDGLATVPDAPGFGLTLDESKFTAGVKVLFDLKA